MRLRLGLLQDQAAIERQIARDAAEAKAKKSKSDIPTVKTEAQTKAEEASGTAHEKAEKSEKDRKRAPRIRPLTEAKAIDSGANFISEGFLFSVGLGLILFETWRSRRKENNRRSDVAEQIAALEGQNRALAEKVDTMDHQLSELRTKGTASSLWQKWHSNSQSGTAASSKKEENAPRVKSTSEIPSTETEGTKEEPEKPGRQ
jgi:optic atrophy 3 protein